MVDSPTTRLRLSPPTVGGDYGTWGSTLNANLSALDDAITGQVVIDLSGLSTLTLTTADGATDQARYAMLAFSGSNSATATCTVTVPANQKMYKVVNTCTNTSVILEVSSSGNTVTIPANGMYYFVFCDGTNVLMLSIAGPSITDWTSKQLVPAADAEGRYAKSSDLSSQISELNNTITNNATTSADAISGEASTRAAADTALDTSKLNKASDTATDLTVKNTMAVEYGSVKIQFQDDGNCVIYDSNNNPIFTVSSSAIEWNQKDFAFTNDLPIDSTQRIQAFNVSVASLSTVSFPEAFSDVPTVIIILGRTNNARAMTASYDNETATSFVLQAQREDTNGASQQTTPWTFSILAVGPK